MTDRKDSFVAAGVALAVLVVYFFAPSARFLSWDDAANLLNNDRWRGLSWDHLRWMWGTRHYGPWQPLSWLSWAMDYAVWGLDPVAFRRTNVLLHALASGLFFLVCRRLLSGALPKASSSAVLFGSVAGAVFFGLHPLRVESVVWITERRDVLSGFFAVLSVLLWLNDRRGLSTFALIGAVLSKGTSIAVVPFLFIVDVVVLGRCVRRSFIGLLPHVAVAVFAAGMNLWGISTGDVRVPDISLGDRLLVSLSGCWLYLEKTFLPLGLSPYYALPLDLGAARLGLIRGSVLAVIVTALCFHRRIRSWAVPIWLAYLVALAPVSGLLQNGRQAAADRYSYLACLPFAVLVGLAGTRLYTRRPRAAVVFISALVVGFSIATIHQSQFWRDDKTLWSRAVALQPDAYLPRSNLASALLAAGEGEAAAPHLRAAIGLEPRDVEARINLGAVLEERGDLAGAEALLREALALRPGDSAAAVNLAGLRARSGDVDGARRLLEGVVARDPNFAAARFNLGLLLLNSGRKAEGLAHLREAVRLDPSLARRLPPR